MQEIGVPRDDGRWVFQYKQCRKYGFALRVILREIPDAALAAELRYTLQYHFTGNVSGRPLTVCAVCDSTLTGSGQAGLVDSGSTGSSRVGAESWSSPAIRRPLRATKCRASRRAQCRVVSFVESARVTRTAAVSSIPAARRNMQASGVLPPHFGSHMVCVLSRG
jgi:hypothetical protein